MKKLVDIKSMGSWVNQGFHLDGA